MVLWLAAQFWKTGNGVEVPFVAPFFVKRRPRQPEYFMRRIEMQFPLDFGPVRATS